MDQFVSKLMNRQRTERQNALVKQLECGCPDSTCADGKSCSHPMRRISAKTAIEKRQENNNQVSSTTPNVMIGTRVSVSINKECVFFLQIYLLIKSCVYLITNLFNNFTLSLKII